MTRSKSSILLTALTLTAAMELLFFRSPALADGTVTPPRPTTPVTTIAAKKGGTFNPCPNRSESGPRDWHCDKKWSEDGLETIIAKTTPSEEIKARRERAKKQSPQSVAFFLEGIIVSEGVDRDPRGTTVPKCSKTGPNLPNCSLFAQNFRHVPGGRRGAPDKTQGVGTRLVDTLIAYSVPRDNGQEPQPKTKGPKVSKFTA
jgi:hypothetical protein